MKENNEKSPFNNRFGVLSSLDNKVLAFEQDERKEMNKQEIKNLYMYLNKVSVFVLFVNIK